jgi:ATP-binding cassette subfamily B protein
MVSCVRRLMAASWRINPRKTVVAVLIMLAVTASTPLLAVALGWMTDAVVARNLTGAATAGAVVALFAIIALIFDEFGMVAYFELSELIELNLHETLLVVSNGSPGISHHERPEQADDLTVLYQDSGQFRSSVESLLNGATMVLAVVLGAVILARQNLLLLLLPVAALAPLLTGRLAESALERAKTRTAEPTRIAINLFQVSTTARYAGELRVSGVEAELRRRYTRLWRAATRGLYGAHVTATLLRAAGQVFFGLAYIGAVLLVVRGAIAGHHSVGQVVLVIALATQVNQQVTAAVTLLQEVQRLANAYRRLDRLRDTVGGRQAPADQAAPDRLRQGITFDQVSFSYPSTDRAALNGVDLTLAAGSTVAIVGENGAGKTTLVKLLCGFYQPSAGRILVDGVDLQRLPIEQWRQRVAAGFQDFVRYEVRALEAVGVGDVPRVSDEAAVNAALERAQATDVVHAMDDGLATQLGTSYADGTELSGGQWQKLALGRALMRETPLLLLLDEPTSALDPQAEHDLFQRYAEQAKRTSEQTGAVTVLVSHRFSTVRMADVIIVVGDGRLLETGDHDTLVRAGGTYAEMFAIQASAYG